MVYSVQKLCLEQLCVEGSREHFNGFNGSPECKLQHIIVYIGYAVWWEKETRQAQLKKKMHEVQCVQTQMQGFQCALWQEVHGLFLKVLIGDSVSKDSTGIIHCLKLWH